MRGKGCALLLGACALVIVGWGVWRLVSQWQYFEAGGSAEAYQMRRNTITGNAELRVNGVWSPTFERDRFAPALSSEDLRQVTIDHLAWGPKGLLCGQATNRGKTDLRGRLALLITVRRLQTAKSHPNERLYSDRALRRTVRWPADSVSPFILDTQLETPDPTMRTTILLQTIYQSQNVGDANASGETNPAGVQRPRLLRRQAPVPPVGSTSGANTNSGGKGK